MTFDAQVEGLRQGAEKIVGRRAKGRIERAQVQQGDVQQSARHVFRADFVVNLNGIGLGQFPAGANVNDRLDDVVTVVVNERQRTRFVGDGQGELVVIDQTDFFDLRGVVDVVQQHAVSEDFGLLARGHLNGLRADFDRHFRVLVRQLQGVVEDFQVFFQGESVSGELLLLQIDEVVQSRDVIEKDQLSRAFERGENAIVILGVLSDPGVAVVDVTRLEIVVETVGHADEPLGEIVGLEAVVRAGVSEVHHQLEGLALERFQREENVIDQQIAIHFVHLEATGDVVEDRRVVRLAESRLVEDVQGLQ